jgi:hypothetical protein
MKGLAASQKHPCTLSAATWQGDKHLMQKYIAAESIFFFIFMAENKLLTQSVAGIPGMLPRTFRSAFSGNYEEYIAS